MLPLVLTLITISSQFVQMLKIHKMNVRKLVRNDLIFHKLHFGNITTSMSTFLISISHHKSNLFILVSIAK